MKAALEIADPLGEEATKLLVEMRTEALRTYPEKLREPGLVPTNDPLVPRSVFLLARVGRLVVGCGALRPINEEAAEIRRMYVAPGFRRRGVARRLLEQLESSAAEFGYRTIRLETGNRQAPALALYRSAGYRRIPPYGQHVNDPISVCFEKEVKVSGPVKSSVR